MEQPVPDEPVVAASVAVAVLVVGQEASLERAVEPVPCGPAAVVAKGADIVAVVAGPGHDVAVVLGFAAAVVVAFAVPFELAASSLSSSQCLQLAAATDV